MDSGHTTPWGRIAEDGTVYVRTSDGERAVGSWLAGTPEEGLRYYSRRYDDLATEVTLLERRASADPQSALAKATALRGSLATANVVGDLGALDERLAKIVTAAEERAAQ